MKVSTDRRKSTEHTLAVLQDTFENNFMLK